jgi:cytochrome c oxidase subunit 2
MFRYLPEQASEMAPKVDWIHNIITDISLFFTVAIVGSMIYFAIRYRERPGKPHPTPRIEGSHTLEMIWTIVPTIICIFIAYYSVVYYKELRAVPENALTINAWAQKWKWDFQYQDGVKRETTGELVVPVGQPIKVVLRSRDVLHSFFIPAMRVKSDALPSKYTYVSFTPVKTGTYQAFCTEYCGNSHSAMLAKLKVVSQDEYNRWINDDSEQKMKSQVKPEERGKLLYQQKGCNACHSLNGTKVIGPTWLKLFGHEGKFTDGTTYKADENYIEESIYNPNLHIVEGYAPNQMPSYTGQLSKDDIGDIIAFMKTLDGSQAEAAPVVPVAAAVDIEKLSPVERGKYYYENKLCKTCHSLDGSAMVGPTFKGIYGRKEVMTDGSELVADDAYLTESIVAPNAHIVKGYPPAMPAGLLTEKEIPDLIEFLKTVK